MTKKFKKNEGVVLIIILFILVALSIMAVSFVSHSAQSIRVSENYSGFVEANLAAEASEQASIAHIRLVAKDKNYTTRGFESDDPIEIKTELGNLEDPVNAQEVRINDQNLYVTLDERTGDGRGYMTSSRVFDNSGRINVNESDLKILEEQLRNFPNVLSSDPERLSSSVIKFRSTIGKFSHIRQLQRSLDISEDIFFRLSRHICTQSAEEEVYFPDGKRMSHTININTASKEVLFSMVCGIEGLNESGESVQISKNDASLIIEHLIKRRDKLLIEKEKKAKEAFTKWEDFRLWLKSLAEENIINEDKAALVFSNVCPFVFSNKNNPDNHFLSSITREDLTKYTIPGRLSCGGIFSIESASVVFRGGKIFSRSYLANVFAIFKEDVHDTQEHFEVNRIIQNDFQKIPDSITGDTSLTFGKITKDRGAIIRSHGKNQELDVNQEWFLHEGVSDKNKNFDGTRGPLLADSWEETLGKKNKYAFRFLVKLDHEPQGQTLLLRNLSKIEGGLGILTEVYYHPKTEDITLSRTLVVARPDKNPKKRQQKAIVYKGDLDPKGFEKIQKMARKIFDKNLEQKFGTASGFLDVGDYQKQFHFAFDVAVKLYAATARGRIKQKNIQSKMNYHRVHFVRVIFPSGKSIWVPVFIEKRSKTLSFSIKKHLSVIFKDTPEIEKVDRNPDRFSACNVAEYPIPPILDLGFHLSRCEFKVKQKMERGKWVSIGSAFRGIEIVHLDAIDSEGSKKGLEDKNLRDSPLNIWYLMGQIFGPKLEFSSTGTYMITDPQDFTRYKTSHFEGFFLIKPIKNPYISNIVVHDFVPRECKTLLFVLDKNGNWISNSTEGRLLPNFTQDSYTKSTFSYRLVFTGNPYFTSMVKQVRLRMLHHPQLLQPLGL